MMEKVKINFCGISELMKLPGVGRRIAGSLIKLRSREGNLTIDSLDWVRKLRVTPQLLSSIDFTPNPDLVGESLGPEGENISGGDTVDTHLVGNQGDSEAANPVSVDQTRWIDSMSTFIAQRSNPQQRELGLPRGRSDSDTRSSVVHHYPLQAPRNSIMLSRSSHVQSRPRPRTPVMSESDMINPTAPGESVDTFRDGSSTIFPHPVHPENRTRAVPQVNPDHTDMDHATQLGNFPHPVHPENRTRAVPQVNPDRIDMDHATQLGNFPHPVHPENRTRAVPQVNPDRIDMDHSTQLGNFPHPVHPENRTRSVPHVNPDRIVDLDHAIQSDNFLHPVHEETPSRSVPQVNPDRTVDMDHTALSGNSPHPEHPENLIRPVPQVNSHHIVDLDHNAQSGTFPHPVHPEDRPGIAPQAVPSQAWNPNFTTQSQGFPHTSGEASIQPHTTYPVNPEPLDTAVISHTGYPVRGHQIVAGPHVMRLGNPNEGNPMGSFLPPTHPGANSSPGESHHGGPPINSRSGIQFLAPAQTGCHVMGTDSSAVIHPHTAYPAPYGPQLSVIAPPNSGYHTIQPINQANVVPQQQGNMGMGGDPLSFESFTGIPGSQGINVPSAAQPQMSFPPPVGMFGAGEGPRPTYPSLSNNRFPVPGMPYAGYPPGGVISESHTQFPVNEPLFGNLANSDNGSNGHQSRGNGPSNSSNPRVPRRNTVGEGGSFNDFSDDDSPERPVNKSRRPHGSPIPPLRNKRRGSELSDDNSEESYRGPNRLTRDREWKTSSLPRGFRPASLPKGLTFDGKTNWASFKRKFETYAEASNWSENEKNHAMCWSLTGKAADYYALLTEREAQIDYSTLMERMERRFGARELPETSYARFASAQQRENEELEDWADRVLTLANRAFKDLPESHMTKQAIIKLCQGCADREAGQNA